MGVRRLAFLAALALLPVSAHADMHPLDCLYGRTTYTNDGLTTTETEEDETQYRLACRALVVDSQGDPVLVKVGTLMRWRGGSRTNASRHRASGLSGSDEVSSDAIEPATPGNGHAEYEKGFFMGPAVFGSLGESGSKEVAFGMIGYYRKWKHFQPLVRGLVGGVTTTSDDELRGMSAIGVGLDVRLGRFGPRVLRNILGTVTLGGRIDGDVVLLWTQPKHTFARYGASVGLRLELGRHP